MSICSPIAIWHWAEPLLLKILHHSKVRMPDPFTISVTTFALILLTATKHYVMLLRTAQNHTVKKLLQATWPHCPACHTVMVHNWTTYYMYPTWHTAENVLFSWSTNGIALENHDELPMSLFRASIAPHAISLIGITVHIILSHFYYTFMAVLDCSKG